MTEPGRPSSLMVHRRRATEVAIHRAAVELIGEHGYDDVTVQMITDRAGVSVRTFFNYFPTKEAAVVLPYGPLDPALCEVVRTGSGAAGLIDDLADLITASIVSYHRDAVGPETLLQMIHDSPTLLQRHTSELATIEADLAELIGGRLGLPVDDRRVEVIATAVMAAAAAAIRRWSAGTREGEVTDEVRACFELLKPLESLDLERDR